MSVAGKDLEAMRGIATADAQTVPAGRTLDYLPIGLFGSVMGLTGLSVAWRLAHARYGVPEWIAVSIGVVAMIAFLALVAGYAVKWITASDAVLAEFRHPIAGNLFGTVLISLLLLPIVVQPFALQLARTLWLLGVVGMVVFAWFIVSRWMSNRQQVTHATPAWIIPVVGMLDVPLAVPSLGFPDMHLVMVLGLAVGLFFAIPLFTLVFSRLLFEPPMPDALKPSILILLAPFAVGMSTYVATTGAIDLFAQSLYVLTLFIFAVLVGQLRHLPRCCPFRVAWWAVSFPLAASAIAALRIAIVSSLLVTDAVAIAMLGFATLVILSLLARTLYGVAIGELRTLSS